MNKTNKLKIEAIMNEDLMGCSVTIKGAISYMGVLAIIDGLIETTSDYREKDYNSIYKDIKKYHKMKEREE